MTGREKLLNQIKALLALGNSSFEEEARTSLHTAFKKMKEHNITFAELAGVEQATREPTDDDIIDAAEVLVREHMRSIGQLGGLRGGVARRNKLSARRRAEIARAAGKASGEARRRKRGY